MSRNEASAPERKRTMADEADIHELYELSVQNVEHEVEFLRDTFRALRGREAYLLREDFCGTASAACQWAAQGSEFFATGVDIDADVLAWGRENRVGRMPVADQPRVKLIESDVMEVDTPPQDIISAFNFSYWIFDRRQKMLAYFRGIREALKDDGVFFVDVFGGSESMTETREKTKHKGFTYVWEQAKFHPVTHFMRCFIHFKFPDGSKIKKAFRYEWRLWTAPELIDLLHEAGFSKATVYWEGEDEDGEGNGEFSPESKGEPDYAWIAYIVAEK